jgi:hypothetical protein
MRTKNPPERGRSSGYSAEIAEMICDRLINGESLRAICADPAMLAKATVFRWLASNQEFCRSFALARECRAEDTTAAFRDSYTILLLRRGKDLASCQRTRPGPRSRGITNRTK